MVQVNILSPHLDDAALGCWHQIEQPDTQVITLFAGIPDTEKRYWWDRVCGLPTGREAIMMRRKENAAALGKTGAVIVDLDFLDRSYVPPPRDVGIIANTIEAVSDPDSSFLACTGIGTYLRTHRDHRTTRQVALELQRRNRDVSFYLEFPRSLPIFRMAEWPLFVDKSKIEAAIGHPIDVQAVELDPAQMARKQTAVEAYESQLTMVKALALGALSRVDAYRWEGVVHPNYQKVFRKKLVDSTD